jgi:hypothetical protein
LGVFTRWLLAERERAEDFFFLNGVLKRVSRLGAAGRSPFVFCACSTPLKASMITASINSRRAVRGTLAGGGSKNRFDWYAFKKWRQKTG